MAAGKGQYAVNFDVVGSQTVTQSSFINVRDQVGKCKMNGIIYMSIFLTSLCSALGSMAAAGTCRSANICNAISPLTVSYFWMSSSSLWLEFEVASTWMWDALSWVDDIVVELLLERWSNLMDAKDSRLYEVVASFMFLVVAPHREGEGR
jgi:hypothetical protein